MSVTAVGLTSGVPGAMPSQPVGAGFVGSFAALLANEMPEQPTRAVNDFDWLHYRRAVFATEDASNRKRLEAIRRRDPALAARMERILRLPIWEQSSALADAQLAQSRRAAETQPTRPGLAAFHLHQAARARHLSLSSVFDQADVVRWT